MLLYLGAVLIGALLSFICSHSSIFEKIAWDTADRLSKGAIHEIDNRLTGHLNTYGNYNSMCEEYFRKHYDFTPEGFQDYIKDRDEILKSHNKFFGLVAGVAQSYKKTVLEER